MANTASPTNHAILSPPCNTATFGRFSSRLPRSPPTIASGTEVAATEQVYELGPPFRRSPAAARCSGRSASSRSHPMHCPLGTGTPPAEEA